jgi:hypothetical protein
MFCCRLTCIITIFVRGGFVLAIVEGNESKCLSVGTPLSSINSSELEALEVRDPRLVWPRITRPLSLERPGYRPIVDIVRT